MPCVKNAVGGFFTPPKTGGHINSTNIYITGMMLGVITFLTYIFIELIARPLL